VLVLRRAFKADPQALLPVAAVLICHRNDSMGHHGVFDSMDGPFYFSSRKITAKPRAKPAKPKLNSESKQ
jgi:hypothetical protein